MSTASLLRPSSRLRSTQLPRLFCSSSRCSGEEKPTHKFEGFVPVYRFPYVAPAVLFTKFKIAQTAVVTLGLAPYYVYQGAIGAEHPNTVAAVLGLAGFAPAPLAAASINGESSSNSGQEN